MSLSHCPMFSVQARRGSGVAEDISRSFKASSGGKNQSSCKYNFPNKFHLWFRAGFEDMILVKWGLAFCLEVWSVVNGEYLIKDVTRQPTVPTSSGLKSYLITLCDHYSINSFLELWEVCLEFRVALPLHHCLLHHVTADRWLLHCRLQIYRVSSWDSPCLHSCSVQKWDGTIQPRSQHSCTLCARTI